jgi:hypothetical protein
VLVLAVVALSLLMLYEPARNLYAAHRASEDLATQLEAITQTNDSLSSDVSSLQTREGIEDEARRRGYVTSGDTAVDMSGVEDAGSAAVASVDASSSEADEAVETHERDIPWYTAALDFVFQYQTSS